MLSSSDRSIEEEPLFQFLFAKKSGIDLDESKPYVAEIYHGYYGPDVKPPPGVRARSLGRVGHITYHAIPGDGYYALRCAVAATLALFWLLV